MANDTGPQTRTQLKNYFQPGAQPSAGQFANLIDSFISVADASGNNYLLLQETDPATVQNPEKGQLIWDGTNFLVYDSNNWVQLGTDGVGLWSKIDSTDNIEYKDGMVVIGEAQQGNVTNPEWSPAHPLNVYLDAPGPNQPNQPGEVVRFGRALIGNHYSDIPKRRAIFKHAAMTDGESFALAQRDTGETQLNAKTDEVINFSIDDSSIFKMGEDNDGIVNIDCQLGVKFRLKVHGNSILEIGNQIIPAINTNQAIPVIISSKTNFGSDSVVLQLADRATARKNTGGDWLTGSDIKLKENIKPYKEGLEHILQIDPVWFQYKQENNSPNSRSYVGVIANEVKKVAPHMVIAYPDDPNENISDSSETLYFDGSPLKFMLVNAVKELAQKVNRLEEEIRHLRDA